MVKVTQKHDECIGCGACTLVCPDFWEMNDDNKAVPKGGQKTSETADYELEIGEKDVECNKEAAEVCPVEIIKIIS